MFGMQHVLFPGKNITMTSFLFQLIWLFKSHRRIAQMQQFIAKYPNIYDLNKF